MPRVKKRVGRATGVKRTRSRTKTGKRATTPRKKSSAKPRKKTVSGSVKPWTPKVNTKKPITKKKEQAKRKSIR